MGFWPSGLDEGMSLVIGWRGSTECFQEVWQYQAQSYSMKRPTIQKVKGADLPLAQPKGVARLEKVARRLGLILEAVLP